MAGYTKWILGGLGWTFGGPIGGLIGFYVGGLFDKKGVLSNLRGSGAGDFSVSLLVLAGAVMKEDGRILKSELEYVRKFLMGQFGNEKTGQMMLLLRELVKKDIQVRDVCLQIKQFMPHASRLQLLHFLFGVSGADGHVHEKEVALIEQISGYLGINQRDFESLKSMFVQNKSANYKILEIEPDATDEDVKKAYRRMAVKYHPDKVSYLGEEIQGAAKEKFQKLNDAYQHICKERNIR